MSYSVKLNGTTVTASKIDQKSLQKIKYSSEQDRFIMKSSMLRFCYYDTDLAFHEEDDTYPENLVEVYDGSDLIWRGIIDRKTIRVSHEDTKFTAYDLFKWCKNWTADDLLVKCWVGMEMSEFSEIVAEAIESNVLTETGEAITVDTDIEPDTDYTLDAQEVIAYDVNGDTYAITNKEAANGAGIKIFHDTSKNLIFFQEATTNSLSCNTFYAGVINGGVAYYFSTEASGRVPMTISAYRNGRMWVTSIDNDTKREIAFYYVYRPDSSTLKFRARKINFDGLYLSSENEDIEIPHTTDPHPDYELYYDSSGDLQYRSKTGGGDYMDFLAAGTEYDKEYRFGDNILGHNESLTTLQFEGKLLPLLRYPFDYSDTEEEENYNIYRMLKDLAIFTDSFIALHLDLQVYSEDQCNNMIISDANLIKTIAHAPQPIEIDFSESLHPNWTTYKSKLADYYSDRYGDIRTVYERELYSSAAIALKNKINGKRVIELTMKDDDIYKVKLIGS